MRGNARDPRRGARRIVAVPVAALLAFGAVFAAAGAAGATPVGTSVGNTGICIGYPDAGGCEPEWGGSTIGVAGSTTLLGATFTATSGSSLNIILEAPGSGLVFPDDASNYEVDNLATSSACSVSNVSVFDSGDTAFVDMPSDCAASAGTQVVVLVNNTTLPTTGDSFSLELETTEDFEPVATNPIDLISVPSSPKSPQANRGDHSVSLGWTAPDSDGGSDLTGYKVYCSSTGTPDPSSTPSATTNASTTSTTVSGLSTHTSYSCVVTAVNEIGQSAPSDVVSAVPDSPPGAPQSFSSTAGNGSVTLFWGRPADVGGTPITGYTAYCSTSYPPTADVGDECGRFGPAQRSGTVRGLINGVPYYVGVTATNAEGEGPMSGVGNPTPTGPPSRPWALRAKPFRGSLELRWKVPTNDGGDPIAGYEIFCSPNDPPVVTFPSSASSTSNRVRVYSLTSGTPYYCIVFAQNTIGTSVSSFVVGATPL